MIVCKKERGFSLVELGLVMAVASLILLLGMSALRSAPDRLGTKGAARTVASLLGQASALARARNAPVAVGIPKGENPTELFLLSGDDEPELERRLSLSDFDGVTVLPGTLGNDTPPELYLSNESLDIEEWSSKLDDLRLLVFLPSGVVKAHGIPLFQGRYHLLISAGVEATELDETITISRVAYPHTVSVGPMGDVRQTTGAGAAFGDPSEAAGKLALGPSDRMSFAKEAEPPALEAIDILPDPERLLLPAGEARVNVDGYLTLVVTARSPNGVPLVCQWSSETGGQLSAQESVLMAYDESLDRWIGRWHWRAPDLPEPEYTLVCQVKDIRGLEAVNEVKATVEVEISQAKQRLLFGTDSLMASGDAELLTVFEDGTGETRLMQPPVGKHDSVGGWAPDGSRMVLTSNREGADELFVANADGTDLHRITFINRGTGNPEFSPTGTRIGFSTSSPRDVWVVNVDGSNAINLTGGAYGPARLSKQTGAGYLNTVWSPDEEYLCFQDGSYKGHIVKSDGTDAPIKLSDSFQVRYYAWHPNSDTIALVDSSGKLYNYSVTSALEPVEVPCDKAVTSHLQYSPDGSKILFCSSGNIQALPSAGGVCTPITSGGKDSCAAWIDNQSISFSRRDGGNRDVYTMTINGAGRTNITNHPFPDFFYGWTPDLSP
jgi:type II secretory pathway pseudopilin PulG